MKIQNSKTKFSFMKTKVKKRVLPSSPFKIQNCRGLSLYLAIMITGMLLALSLGVSSILVGGLKTLAEAGNSLKAFYAAETGIERELFEGNPAGTTYSGTLVDGASFTVSVLSASSIKSLGSYKNSRRAIQALR